MNAAPFVRPFHALSLAATLLALLALALLPGSHAAAATLGSAAGLTLSPAQDSQVVSAGQTAYHTYVLTNNGAATAVVQLAVRNDQGWPAVTSATQLKIAPRSAVKFEVKVAVPATAGAASTATIEAIGSSTQVPT